MPTNIKLSFPNPYGFPLPTSEQVDALQSRYKFSDDYANFLKSQNGFSRVSYGYGNEAHPYFINTDEIHIEGEVLSILYALNDSEFESLIKRLDEYSEMTDYLMPIGSDPGGNVFVEILVGKRKGEIGCLNHEAFYGSVDELMIEIDDHYRNETDSSAPAVIELKEKVPNALDVNGELKKLIDLDPEDKVALLSLMQWDIYARTANSFKDFINNIIVVKEDEYFKLYVKDQ